MNTLVSPKFAPLFLFFGMMICFIPHSSFSQKKSDQLFKELNPKKLGISFKNTLKEDAINNILRYEYFYNGAGVAIGDLDNDGLEDIVFTGNMVDNKVYQNLGNWKFEDRTKKSGIVTSKPWTTGVSLADINADGWLDIYISYSGKGDEESKRNELWINQKDFTFQNEAKQYGLDDPSNSTQGLFFDFDRDGDLDLFLLNHHIQVISEIEFDEVKQVRHPYAGDKLYRNEEGKFIDISENAGIKGSALGFGLGVVASDVNGDGWMDLLVTNDYIEPDYLYINNQDGTFSDKITEYFQHISHFSMGADIADINNDGLQDVYTLDMLPEDNERQKLLYGPENYEQYALMIEKGFYHQNMRNMLQLNQGNGVFSEIGQLANISNTDWSWSALFFDATNNGNKDLLVTNGYYKDYTNRDFLKYKGDYYFKQAVAKEKADTLLLVTNMTSTPVHNYFFENQGNLAFEDRSIDWGFEKEGFSSGAAYGDLDNDGDLDVVINHLNAPAGIYENQSKEANWIQVLLKGTDQNTFGLGAKVKLKTADATQTLEIQPIRGFQSAVSPRGHFGLGESDIIQSLEILWPDGTFEVITNPEPNQLLKIKKSANQETTRAKLVTPLLKKSISPNFTAGPVGFNDLKRQPLMITMPSYVSPILAQADLDGDGNPEVFVGGTKDHPGKVFSYKNGTFSAYSGFRSESKFTDGVAVFEDFNHDGKPDLFIGSGGFHDYLSSDESIQDRLYLNDGMGKLKKSSTFPSYSFSTGTAQSMDLNGDKIPDLFVGAKLLPGRYPLIPKSKVLLNDGNGDFKEASESFLPNEGLLGLVTSSEKIDLNQDGRMDLILAGEFMPLTFLINTGNGLEDQTEKYLTKSLSGWWNTLSSGDFDGDGDIDLVAGNFGLNSQFEASESKLLRLYGNDFDNNGSIDPILECFIGEEAFPYPSRDELLDQMVSMRSKFTDYASYSKAKIEDLFTVEEIEGSQILEANTLSSYYLENTGNGFVARALPRIAQSFPIYAILASDINQDGHLDLVLGGNQNFTRIRVGMIDSGLGLVLLGDGKGNFTPLSPEESGLTIKGDIKSILSIEKEDNQLIIFGINQQSLQSFTLND